MTSVFVEDGKNVPCTVIEAGPCVVTQVKTVESDGYTAVQLAFDEKKEKQTTAPMMGHFKKANTTPKRKLAEFRDWSGEMQLGDVITVDIFNTDRWVDVTGITKGRGFQGVVKRHGFGGVGGQTHGQHNRQRHPGSMGASSYPSRVFSHRSDSGRVSAYGSRARRCASGSFSIRTPSFISVSTGTRCSGSSLRGCLNKIPPP